MSFARRDAGPGQAVIQLIIENAELDKVLQPVLKPRVELVWEPRWAPDGMSAQAKRFMGW